MDEIGSVIGQLDSDRGSNPDSSSFDIDLFREWVAESARSQNVSETELIEQLMSSYWILDELTGMISENREQDGRTEQSHDPNEKTADSSDLTIDRTVVDLLKLVVESTIDQGRFRPSREQTSEGVTTQLLVEAFIQQGEQAAQSRVAHTQLSAQITDLQEEINQVEDRIQTQQELTDQERQELQGLEERIAEYSKQLEKVDRTLGETITQIETDLSHRTDDHTDHVDQDLKKVEEILGYLHRSVNNLDDKTDSLHDEYRDFARIIDDYERRQQLADIKTAANQKRIQTASCDSCNTPVNIALLTDSRCPHCRKLFDSVTTWSGLWRTKNILRTRSEFIYDSPRSLSEALADHKARVES